jgi:hypothetical protein
MSLLERIAEAVAPAGKGECSEQPLAGTTTPARNRFCFDGKDWRVRYGDEDFLLDDGPGPFYIASLLDHPTRTFTATELRQARTKFCKAPAALKSLYASEEDHILDACLESGADDLGEVLDAVGVDYIRDWLRRNNDEIEAARRAGNAVAVASLQNERAKVGDYLLKSRRPGGRPVTLGDKSKADRDQVCNAINRTLRKIEEKSPPLHRHLKNALKCGPVCSYEPENVVSWNA